MKIDKGRIYIEKEDCYKYPRSNYQFHPSSNYPEYSFSEISKEENNVYDMVRRALYGFGMDTAHFGTKEWNPLGEYINQGDRVLIKPNMVKHYDSITQNECTLTHPSVVRAVIDYCIIAGAGEIILGDAPIQGADMEMILEKNHYNDIIAFYKKKKINIRFVDFRNYIVKKHMGMTHEIQPTQNTSGVVNVDLGEASYHFCNGVGGEVYETCGYDSKIINENHTRSRHNYVVTEEVVKADVIINIPKPKTHRFAGLTAAQKNFVGIVADKESVPHFKDGVKGEYSDETNQNNVYSRSLHGLYKRYMKKNAQRKYLGAFFTYILYRLLLLFKNDSLYIHGQWHGNDTIWRSTLDLNKIVLFADKRGVLHWEEPQRKILTIGDMIIVGEGEGPLSPSPKEYGMIVISDCMPLFDWVVCTLFGFDHKLLPTIQNGVDDSMLCGFDVNDVILKSNYEEWNQKRISNFKPEDKYHVVPHPFWAEILE